MTKKLLCLALALLTACASLTTAALALEPHSNGLPFRSGWFSNDPSYTFSSDYKSSVWFQNFSSIELTSNERNNVLRVAISQLGYHEGNSDADFGGKNTAGNLNITEYNRLPIVSSTGKPYGEEGADGKVLTYSFNWCACFVNWCLNQAHIDHAHAELSCGRWIDDWFTKQENGYSTSKAYGGKYTPQPADMIFFDWDQKNNWPEHIGLVLYVTDTTVYTVEGNTSSGYVAIRSYPLDSKKIKGYGRPAYAEGDEETLDFSFSTVREGTYIVHVPDSTMTSAGQSVSLPVGSSVKVTGISDDVLTVEYNGATGTMSRSDLVLLTPDDWSDVGQYVPDTEPVFPPETEETTEPETTEPETEETTEPEETTSEPESEETTEPDEATSEPHTKDNDRDDEDEDEDEDQDTGCTVVLGTSGMIAAAAITATVPLLVIRRRKENE